MDLEHMARLKKTCTVLGLSDTVETMCFPPFQTRVLKDLDKVACVLN